MTSSPTMRPPSSDLNAPRIDSYRFSMANLEDSQDVDLDAILGELNALENQYEEAIQSTKAGSKEEVGSRLSQSSVVSSSGASSGSSRSSSGGSAAGSGSSSGGGGGGLPGARTHSPDNDSAFSDSVSLLSSESSASSGRGPTEQTDPNGSSKAEKIRLALQKMKDASVKKLFVKVFNEDGSGKSLLVDEGMSCGYITRILAEKNHRPLDPRCALVEHLTDLHMERVYEDHEPLVENLMRWTRDSKNRLLFSELRAERTLLFSRPQLVIGAADAPPPQDPFTAHNLLEEFFSGAAVPSLEGPLHIKTDSRKGWKRHHCILRASGLYYWPKDKAKSSSKDLVCLATFDVNHVYYGVGWKKKYKSPTEFGFAIKHPCLQQPKSVKYIKYLCADDEVTRHRWVTAIRILKYGRQLLVNYKGLMEECSLVGEETLLEGSSVASQDLEGEEEAEVESENSSLGGGMGGGGTSGNSSSCGGGGWGEADFPSGTIKRKPPKIPLTATTRQLKEIAIGGGSSESYAEDLTDLPPPPPELLEDYSGEDEECELPPPPPPPPLSLSLSLSSGPPALHPRPRESQAFLSDLARVMSSKWQVAQKCKAEPTTTPHQVLGFRDPPPSEDGYCRQNSVREWVVEHYGSKPPPSLYENIYRPQPLGYNPGAVKKRPPPPPPRALTTHLTTVPPIPPPPGVPPPRS